MNDMIWLTFRRLRLPLIVMIIVYFLSVIGMVMIPGIDGQGRQVQLSYLDAAYFVAILTTTIGFGEIPYSYTDAQRLYVFIILFPNVIAWLYSFGTVLGLLLDPQFGKVMRRSRFERRVARLPHQFFIVCGFGNTGKMIVDALIRRGFNMVVLEREESTVHGMSLHEELAHVPALSGDVTDRRTLEMAGLLNPKCQGVMAITNEDHANLTIAITTKLLRPELQVFARSETPMASANMASFGTDHIVDPYEIFAMKFFLALSSPIKHLVYDWLISAPGSELSEQLEPPSGHWVLCGMGRFGQRIAERLEQAALPYTVIDVQPDRIANLKHGVLGRGTSASTLLEAGIKESVGIVAGTGDDVDNLSILMTAQELNPRLFMVARQERQENDQLFAASHAHLVAKRSMIVSRRILGLSTTPELVTFVQHLMQEDEEFTLRVASRLRAVLKGYAPSLWKLKLSGKLAPGLLEAQARGLKIRLEHLSYNSHDPETTQLPCVCLLLLRGAGRVFLPERDQEIHAGDELFFAGRESARIEMKWTLTEPDALLAVASGKPVPRGAFFRWLGNRRKSGWR